MSFFLGIDLGTSYFKAGVFDEQGNLKGLGRCCVNKQTDHTGVCEVPVPVFWETLRICLGEAIKNAAIHPKEIKTVSYSSQANSFILLDQSDEPLTPLILWPDQRVNRKPDSLQRLISNSDFCRTTGLGIAPGNQSLVAKLDWFRTLRPEIWKRVKTILSISDYLTFSLTGEKVADYSTSSMTGLFSISERNWWKNALDLFCIDSSHLSSPTATGTFISRLTSTGAALTGLSLNTDYYIGALDHHMVAIGAGLPVLNQISESTGTVLASVNYRQGYFPKEGINIAPGLKEDAYFQMAFNENGATALEWYQQNYAPEQSIAELVALAEKIPPGCDGLTASPNANRYKNLDGFIYQKNDTKPAHFIRAILESTSLSLLNLLTALGESKTDKQVVSSGGGAKSRLWMQIKADMLNRTFLLPECNELACQGAAMLGFMGSLPGEDPDKIIRTWIKYKDSLMPDPVNTEKYKIWQTNQLIKL